MAAAARPAAAVWRGALLASLAAAAASAPLPLYDDALASGWSGGAYAATSGAFNFSSDWAHLGTGRAVRAALAPFGTLVFRSSRRDTATNAARLALYVHPLGPPGSAPAAAPLALSISIATWLPGGTAMPVASLCTAAQLARGGQLLAAAPDGGPGCAISGPDADGWQRLAVDVDGFGGAGWDEVQVSDVTGRGGVVYLDRIALLSAADVAQPGAWDANAAYCLDRLDSLQYGCTVPPSAECCADYAAFNAQGCSCIQAVRERGGDDLQLATQYAAPDACGTQLVLQDDPACFAGPPRSPAGDGTPPLPAAGGAAASAAALRAPPVPPARPRGGRSREAKTRELALETAPYAGIGGVTLLATLAAHVAIQRRIALVLREGRTDDCAADARLLAPLLLR